jgi:hypothetical protein
MIARAVGRALHALAIAAMISPLAAFADTTGSLSGQVRDLAGKPLAGATVIAVSPAEVVQTTSDANGRYCFLGLIPGTYTIAIREKGYRPSAIAGVLVPAGNRTVADDRLYADTLHWVTIVDYPPSNLVRSGVTADLYQIMRSNPLFDTSRTIDELLPFVPGVLVIGGSAPPR